MHMPYQFAHRMDAAPESFLDTLFAVSSDPSIISFAGGLPSAALIDVEGIAEGAAWVLEEDGKAALQYATCDGYLPLREWIADRYRRRLGLPARPEEIRIVNGSQQCLDLVAKIFCNPSDAVGMERPGYLGAVEAFSLYEPAICGVPLAPEGGPEMEAFSRLLTEKSPVFFYGIPNFQNPSGTAYPEAVRREAGTLCREVQVPFYEDDAFGELAFDGRPRPPVKRWAGEFGIMSGSFSKTIAPGMRCGWLWAPEEIITTFDVAKQAADLHSNHLSQMILHRYLTTHDYDAHLAVVRSAYAANCRLMSDLLDERLPACTHTRPEGGMFMTAALPEGVSSMELFRAGLSHRVAVMPGRPFFADGGGDDCFRLNFSTAGEEEIKEGMARLARALATLVR